MWLNYASHTFAYKREERREQYHAIDGESALRIDVSDFRGFKRWT